MILLYLMIRGTITLIAWAIGIVVWAVIITIALCALLLRGSVSLVRLMRST